MKDVMRRRVILPAIETCSTSEDFIYGLEPLSKQLRNSRFGGLPLDHEKAEDSRFDEDDVFDVDPTTDPTMDRFERTEAAAATISDRMKKKKQEDLNHATV